MIVSQHATEAAVTSLTYPGIPESVPAVRRLVRAVLASSPRVCDLELVAAELATNAIQHTPSGLEGGTFTITVRQRPGQARLEVTDQGTVPWHPAQANGDGMAEHGRGLAVVAALTDEAGHAVTEDGGVSWAGLSWLPADPQGLRVNAPGLFARINGSQASVQVSRLPQVRAEA